jgi:predicted DNA-binding transcriptional regulator YafY
LDINTAIIYHELAKISIIDGGNTEQELEFYMMVHGEDIFKHHFIYGLCKSGNKYYTFRLADIKNVQIIAANPFEGTPLKLTVPSGTNIFKSYDNVVEITSQSNSPSK